MLLEHLTHGVNTLALLLQVRMHIEVECGADI